MPKQEGKVSHSCYLNNPSKTFNNPNKQPVPSGAGDSVGATTTVGVATSVIAVGVAGVEPPGVAVAEGGIGVIDGASDRSTNTA